MVDVDRTAVLLQVQTPAGTDTQDDETRPPLGQSSPVGAVWYLVWNGWTLGDFGGLFASTASSWMDPLSEATAR